MKLKQYLAAAFNKADIDDRTEKMFNWLVAQNIIAEDEWIRDDDGQYLIRDEEGYICDRCNSVHRCASDLACVIINRRGDEEMWCEDCLDDNAFYCNQSGNWYASRNFSRVTVNGEGICYEENEDDLYFWDCDGEYHWDSEPEEDEEDESGRSEYHGADRSHWKTKDPNYDLFGVELEMCANDSSDLPDICNEARNQGFLAESDGSLNAARGVEIVGFPMPLKDFRNGAWKDFIASVQGKAKAWQMGKGYGIHVSIGRHTLTLTQQAKFIRFFVENQSFCEKIAGRESSTWANYELRGWSSVRNAYLERYDAAAIRDRKRIEVRIFRATLKWSSFLKNVQFVAALVEFVRVCSIRDIKGSCGFCEFVTSPANANRFRELVNFLKDKNLLNISAS